MGAGGAGLRLLGECVWGGGSASGAGGGVAGNVFEVGVDWGGCVWEGSVGYEVGVGWGWRCVGGEFGWGGIQPILRALCLPE